MLEARIGAVLDELGLSIEDHSASIAYVKDEEWEVMITKLNVDGAPVKIGHKAKLRRLLAVARIICSLSAQGE